MKTATEHLKIIRDKLQQLLKQYFVLQKENKQLKEDLGKTKEQIAHHKLIISNLKQQVDVLKFNAGEMREADKKDFEKRINSYLKEIDRCIALLGE
jgi:chromosome segregation ATPase